MLTAMAVLSLLLLLLFSAVAGVSYVADSSQRTGDIDTEARQVLDRIGLDIAGMLIRPDVDQFYYLDPSNIDSDKMFFYSHATGYFASEVDATTNNPVTLVGYRINTTPNTTDNPNGQPVLERLAQGLMWDGASEGLQYLTFQPPASVTAAPVLLGGTITNQWSTVVGPTGDASPPPSSSYYDAIGRQVFRLGICFQLQNGTFSRFPGFTNSAPVYPGSITNTVAIVVAVAALDSRSRQLISPGGWAYLTNTAFPINPQTLAANPPVLMDSQWNTVLNSPSFAQNAIAAGIPAVVASHIKIYQRYYYLNVPKAR
jgi:hypothetical protein